MHMSRAQIGAGGRERGWPRYGESSMDSYALVASARTRAARARQLPTAHCHAAQTRVYVDDASSLVAFRVGPSPGSEAIMKRRTTGRA